MLKVFDYQPPLSEPLEVCYETDFLTSGEGMTPKPMGASASYSYYDDEM